MASSSNHPFDASERTQDLEYLYASNTNVSNFVTVKLSGESNYHIWKTQMLCLLESHDMRGLVDDAGFDLPRSSSKNSKIMKKYESLLKGWIFGSVNDDMLSIVCDLDSVKDVWNKLKSLYDPTMSSQQVLALHLMRRSPKLFVESDEVLMVLARTFPSGLDVYGQALVYPSLLNIRDKMIEIARSPFQTLTNSYWEVKAFIAEVIPSCHEMCVNIITIGLGVFAAPPLMLFWIYYLARILILSIYFLLFKVARTVVKPIRNMEQKRKEFEEAKHVLELVCQNIKQYSKGSHHSVYSGPILEAARQNAYEVVNEILLTWPEAIQCKDKNGHDIIQLATIHRSEKVYNLIYIMIYMMEERTLSYRTMEDSSQNNILHLAGRLAPSDRLHCTTGAALQLQRELQWFEEVKKLVFPAYITKKNILMETPGMVFTKEHKKLVKEGEAWMKVVAESCSITAALITTIVFAAAITVPGGSNQSTGTPLFTKEIAFTIFAVSDAVSLFSSVTALLLFLSILTARFAEQDFLITLPRRLIIGLCALLLSTIAMMVAFGATLFLVFCHHKPWMLTPIAALACIPIASFVGLKFPLIVDLFRSTYMHNFGFKRMIKSNRFDANAIRFSFG